MEEKVVLVTEKNRMIGTEEKMAAHLSGQLHRAFSVFVFNSKGELLIQKRNKKKYHSGGLWSNTVCSHPRAGERILAAAHRRLKEEMGFDCPLRKKLFLIYEKKFENGLTEHEYDNIFFGQFDGEPKKNSREVSDFKWISLADLKNNIAENPEQYTYWFKKIIQKNNLFN